MADARRLVAIFALRRQLLATDRTLVLLFDRGPAWSCGEDVRVAAVWRAVRGERAERAGEQAALCRGCGGGLQRRAQALVALGKGVRV